ncbi:MAG TPA: class I SAM-dependent methyltransferase [Ktedonobacteraceae bacterium]
MKKGENTYFIDKDDESELARLIEQDTMYNLLFDLLPKEFEAFEGARVLDLACGPGGWALEVSREFPELSVTGVDLSEQMIRYARAQAQVRNLKTQFRIMDILQLPWEDLPDRSFDCINVRFITSLVPKHLLPALYHECWRVLTEGGILRYIEMAGVSTPTSPANEKLGLYAHEAAYRAGLSFSPYDMGTGAVTAQILKRLGFEHRSLTPYILDVSAGAPMHHVQKDVLYMSIGLLKPFLLRMTDASEEEIDRLQEDWSHEWDDSDFCGHYYMCSITVQKP